MITVVVLGQTFPAQTAPVSLTYAVQHMDASGRYSGVVKVRTAALIADENEFSIYDVLLTALVENPVAANIDYRVMAVAEDGDLCVRVTLDIAKMAAMHMEHFDRYVHGEMLDAALAQLRSADPS